MVTITMVWRTLAQGRSHLHSLAVAMRQQQKEKEAFSPRSWTEGPLRPREGLWSPGQAWRGRMDLMTVC